MNDPFVLYHIATINKDPEVAHLLMTSLPPLSRYVKKMDLMWQLKNKMVKKISYDDREYYVLPNGDKHGIYKSWYESGQLFCQTSYKNGQEDGEYKLWYDNGQLTCQGPYKKGMKEGEYKSWLPSGQLFCQRTYKNGKIVSQN